jgi:hypothetical protein
MSRDRHVPIPESSSRPSARGKFIVAAVFLAVICAFYFFDLMAYLSLDMLKANRDKFLSFTEEHYAQAVLLFILIYIAQTAFSLPGATLLTLMGGFLFGTLLAVLYVNIGATTGATLAVIGWNNVLETGSRHSRRDLHGTPFCTCSRCAWFRYFPFSW